jgi:NTE family protein
METWPEKRVLIATVNADTGERRAFDRDSGIDLVDAVIASTASLGAPPTLFQGEHYIDGRFYSTDNADLAIDFDRVMILALKRPPEIPSMSVASLDETVKTLQDNGALVEVIQPDETTLEALAAAGGVLNSAISAPAARAGRLQGGRIVSERISSFGGRERRVCGDRSRNFRKLAGRVDHSRSVAQRRGMVRTQPPAH